MKMITKNNYEAYLLDYLEGNLSPEGTAELMLFLENNPALKEDLEDFDLVQLEAPAVQLDQKDNLKQKEGGFALPADMESLMIGEIEGVNSTKESKKLALFLKANPAHAATLTAYQNTRLQPSTLIFEGKTDLKQENDKVIPLYWWYTSAAAVILTIFLLNLNWEGQTPENNIVEKGKQEQVKENKVQDEQKSVEANKEEVEKVFLAEEPPVKKKVNSTKKKQVVKKKESVQKEPVVIDEIEPEQKTLANEEDILDTGKLAPLKEEAIINEEVHYADNVKITFDEEQEQHTNEEISIPSVTPKKYTKLDAVRAVVKQQVNEKFLKRVKDESTLALHSGPLNFLRGKNKRQ